MNGDFKINKSVATDPSSYGYHKDNKSANPKTAKRVRSQKNHDYFMVLQLTGLFQLIEGKYVVYIEIVAPEKPISEAVAKKAKRNEDQKQLKSQREVIGKLMQDIKV